MKIRIFFTGCLVVLVSFLACAHARVVSRQPGVGGEIAFPQASEESREKAMEFARSNCGTKKVQILNAGKASLPFSAFLIPKRMSVKSWVLFTEVPADPSA